MKTSFTPAKGITLLAGATLALTLYSSEPATSVYVAHEWGTFTSVQGDDGGLLNWRPLETSDLPEFVYDWSNPGFSRAALPFLSKSAMTTLQRMETPVIYFYTDAEQTVDVEVKFPAGTITEWFPQAQRIGPAMTRQGTGFLLAGRDTHTAKDSRIEWTGIRIIPENTTAMHTKLPRSGLTETDSHYFAARDTDSALVRLENGDSGAAEYEKFLFYRGAGSFATPLRVKLDANDKLTLINNGGEALSHFFVLTIGEGKGKFLYHAGLNARDTATIELGDNAKELSPDKLQDELSRAMTEALVKEGLFQREAVAMVNTWKDSWFTEEGVRVLYILPRSWTDATLPLTLTPAPTRLVRVMVGRAEIIPPSVSSGLRQQLAKAAEGNVEAKAAAFGQLKRLGRFAEPALQLALKDQSRETIDFGGHLFHTLSQPVALQDTTGLECALSTPSN